MNKATIAILSRDKRLYTMIPLLKKVFSTEKIRFSPVYVDAKYMSMDRSLAVLKNADAVLASNAEDALSLTEYGIGNELCVLPVMPIPQIKRGVPVNLLFILPQSENLGTEGRDALTETAITPKKIILKAFDAAKVYSDRRRKQITVVKSSFISFYNREFEHLMITKKGTDSRIITNEFMIKELIEIPSYHDVIVVPSVEGALLYRMTSNLYTVPAAMPLMLTGSSNIFAPAETLRPWTDESATAEVFAAAMMLEHGLGLEKAAERLRKSFIRVLEKGLRTLDICSEDETPVTVSEMMNSIEAEL